MSVRRAMHVRERLRDHSNLRDMGGVATRDGRLVRRGHLFRSGALSALNPDEFSALQARGIRLVCDLRSATERVFEPSPWPAHAVPETLAMDVNGDLRSGGGDIVHLLRDDPTANGALRLMHALYEELPGALLPHLRTLFARLAQGPATPLLVHCAAGKDRTGVFCAFLLLALGVPRDDVLRDYRRTADATHAEPFKAHVARAIHHSVGHAPPAEVVNALVGAEASYLEAALAAAASEHGSVEAYLRQAGLDQETAKALHERLLTT